MAKKREYKKETFECGHTCFATQMASGMEQCAALIRWNRDVRPTGKMCFPCYWNSVRNNPANKGRTS